MRFDLHYFIQQFNLAYQMELLLRIVIACILGYMIGYERKSRDKSAGIWTTAGGGMAIGAGRILSASAEHCWWR